jgi:hypothetical protein
MKAIPLGLQAASLKKIFPEGSTQYSHRGLQWTGQVTPQDWCREYRLKLDYRLGANPKVTVKSPSLHYLAEGKKIPHLYDQKSQHLCLYFPGVKLWMPSMYVSKTIIPWAHSWLIFFELWLLTGVWYGRAAGHPGDDPVLRTDSFG